LEASGGGNPNEPKLKKKSLPEVEVVNGVNTYIKLGGKLE
jgi:hypothetical protein